MSRRNEKRRATRLAVSVGTAGFEYSGPSAGPLFYLHLSVRACAIRSHPQECYGKLCGKLTRDGGVARDRVRNAAAAHFKGSNRSHNPGGTASSGDPETSPHRGARRA